MNTKFYNYLAYLCLWMFALLGQGCQHYPTPAMIIKQAPPFDGKPEMGYASWYGDDFHGKKTSSGEIYNMFSMTAAHRTAPFGTKVRVSNLDNGKQAYVTVNDRGPFVKGRIMDVSRKAAEQLGMMENGTAKVKLEFLGRQSISQASPSTKPTMVGSTYVQLGSFQLQTKAIVFIVDIKQHLSNLSPQIYKENDLFRVRTGPYRSENDAQLDVDLLKREGFDGFILHVK